MKMESGGEAIKRRLSVAPPLGSLVAVGWSKVARARWRARALSRTSLQISSAGAFSGQQGLTAQE